MKKAIRNTISRSLPAFCMICFAMVCFGQVTEIELKNNFFYLNNQKFFIKGIGYEVGAYPGMLPWNRPFNETVLRSDLKRIEEGGFNTIRTWSAFTKSELEVIQDYNLKIIMGLWIDPAGDFSDPNFVRTSILTIKNTLNTTKNFQNIIAYLIMNEPLPDHIFSVGFDHTYSLWMQVKELIHENHPGIPVSFANTCVGDFINPGYFDFSAMNIYPYNPSTVNHSHIYPAYVQSLRDFRKDDHPLIVTEYGLSVSPSGPGSWDYGGNTTSEQTSGILYMYRSLIDGGAGGSCVFNYSDGWWKAGNEFAHDDAAEEWFGLVEYTSLSDKIGSVRPVWDSLKTYNQAIIVSPKNENIYGHKIPVEIFSSDSVNSFKAVINDLVVMDEVIEDNYFIDSIQLDLSGIEDVNVDFVFYNTRHQQVKRESIQLLATVAPFQIPEITIGVVPQPSKGNRQIKATYTMLNPGPLETDYKLDYTFYYHIGWDYGNKGSAVLSAENQSYSATYNYTSAVDVVTLAAGMNFTYNDFTRRIVSRKTFVVGDTSYTELPSAIRPDRNYHDPSLIWPNPASDKIYISNTINSPRYYFIVNPTGLTVARGDLRKKTEIDISWLSEGLYYIVIQSDDNQFFTSLFMKSLL